MHSSYPDPGLRRPLACSFPGCHYRANFVGGLKRHINLHHNPERRREHVCTLCLKTFYTEQCLRGHVNGVHTLEKSYKCSKCCYTSAYSANLIRHNKTAHEPKKPPVKWLSCQSCDYRTRFKQYLGLHVMTAHSNYRRFQCEETGCSFSTNYAPRFKKHLLNP